MDILLGVGGWIAAISGFVIACTGKLRWLILSYFGIVAYISSYYIP